MTSFSDRFENRRRLLQWLSASPLLASPGSALGGVDRPSKLPDLEANAPLIASPSEAINVFDFEPVFFKNVPPAHIGYMALETSTRRRGRMVILPRTTASRLAFNVASRRCPRPCSRCARAARS